MTGWRQPKTTTYRLLYLDPLTGWIDHYDEFEAASDDAAREYAETWAAGQRIELWCGHRRLAQLPVTPRPIA